jgi:hypothetical protein
MAATGLWLLGAFSGPLCAAASKDKDCLLYLAASTEFPEESHAGTLENQRFLQFVRDLKGMGVVFSSLTAADVQKEFEELSHKNLQRLLKNLDAASPARTPLNTEPEFVIWKNVPEAAAKFSEEKLPTDQEMIRHGWVSEKKGFFLELSGNFHGTSFLMESAADPLTDSLNKNSGTRAFLNRDFHSPWSYALPLANRFNTHDLSFIDNQFFPFLEKADPDFYALLFEDLKFLFPPGATEEDLLTRNLFGLLSMHQASMEPLLKAVQKRKSEMKRLLLSVPDAALLMKAHPEIAQNITIVVNGILAAGEYHLSVGEEVPHEARPTPLPFSWKRSLQRFGAPQLNPDTFFIPAGPDKS